MAETFRGVEYSGCGVNFAEALVADAMMNVNVKSAWTQTGMRVGGRITLTNMRNG